MPFAFIFYIKLKKNFFLTVLETNILKSVKILKTTMTSKISSVCKKIIFFWPRLRLHPKEPREKKGSHHFLFIIIIIIMIIIIIIIIIIVVVIIIMIKIIVIKTTDWIITNELERTSVPNGAYVYLTIFMTVKTYSSTDWLPWKFIISLSTTTNSWTVASSSKERRWRRTASRQNCLLACFRFLWAKEIEQMFC